MGYQRSQTVFSTGELDPRLVSRIDLQRYPTALATAVDVTLSPQGPAKRRPGTVIDDDADGFPTWLLPFDLAQLNLASDSITWTWTGATAGAETVSDNEHTISLGKTQFVHLFFTANTTGSAAASDYDLRLEAYDPDAAEWVETPYARIDSSTAVSARQESGGGNLATLSSDKTKGFDLRSFTKLRARVKSMPGASLSVTCVAYYRDKAGASLAPSAVRLLPFNFSFTAQYIVAFTSYCITVFEQTLASNGEHELTQRAQIQGYLSGDELPGMDFVQAYDTMILVHEDHRPNKVVRQGSKYFWDRSSITFTSDFVTDSGALHIPQDPVDDAAADNAGQDVVWTIELLNFATNDPYQLFIDGAHSESIKKAAGGSGDASRIQSALNAIPELSGTFTVTSNSDGTINIAYGFSDKSLVPEIDNVDYVVAQGSGVIVIWQSQVGRAYTNDKWSTAAGWPRSVTLYQDRLWFGGAKSYPDELWGSRVGDLYSFWNKENLDNEAISARIRSRQLLNIRAIYPGRNLQFFTDEAEFYAPQGSSSPLTPNTFVIQRATNRGIAEDVRPVEVTGATIFLEANKDAVREFLFVDTQQSYDAQDISLLSPHLLHSPLSCKRWGASSGKQFDLVLFPSGANGDMAVFGSLRDQKVAGWWHWTGDWRDVEVMRRDLYGARRTDVRGDACNVICRFDDNAFLDLVTIDPSIDLGAAISDGVIDNLYVHKGHEVQIRVDGSYYDTTALLEASDSRYTGSGNPQIDLATAIDTDYQVGRPFTAKIQQLPTAIQAQSGLIWMNRKKRIMRGTVEVRGTSGIELATKHDGSDAELYAAEVSVGTSAPDTTTGRVVFGGRLGWDDYAQLTVQQTLPYPMEILSIQTEVDL